MICFILLLAIITACEPLHNGSAVIIVKTWTDIERGLPISLVTETDLLTRPKQDEMILHAKIPSVFCTRVQLKNTRQGRWKVEKDGQAKKEKVARGEIHLINIHKLFTLTLWKNHQVSG